MAAVCRLAASSAAANFRLRSASACCNAVDWMRPTCNDGTAVVVVVVVVAAEGGAVWMLWMCCAGCVCVCVHDGGTTCGWPRIHTTYVCCCLLHGYHALGHDHGLGHAQHLLLQACGACAVSRCVDSEGHVSRWSTGNQHDTPPFLRQAVMVLLDECSPIVPAKNPWLLKTSLFNVDGVRDRVSAYLRRCLCVRLSLCL